METSKTEAVYLNREEGRLMAKVAQQAGRFEDMVMYMREVISLADAEGTDPSQEEKSLLSAAYKGAVNSRRAAWQVVVAAIETAEKEKKGELTEAASSDPAAHQQLFLHRDPSDEYVDASNLWDTDSLSCSLTHEIQSDNDDQPDTLDMSRIRLGPAMDPQNPQNHAGHIHDDFDGAPARILQGNAHDNALELLARYRKILECEIYGRCRNLVKLLDKHVHAEEPESKAFFLKLKADYLRYIAEVQTRRNDKNQTTKETLSLYREAQDIVKIHLPATHHTRLGLALNFSVFYADIMNSFEQALILATEAIQDAMMEGDKLDEDLNKDCAAILELIQGNIKLWNGMVVERDKHGDNKVPGLTSGSTKIRD